MRQPSNQNDARKASQKSTVASHKHRRQPTFPGNRIGTYATVPCLPSQVHRTELSDLAAYLAHHDLLTAGFKVFDNRPESYLSRKSMNCSATEELDLKASEVLDLLTKWLAGSHCGVLWESGWTTWPTETGLRCLWQRLDKSYSSPEVIEASLFQCLQTVPKISNKDTPLLQEIADLLLQLEYAQNENYLPGFNYLNTPWGKIQ